MTYRRCFICLRYGVEKFHDWKCCEKLNLLDKFVQHEKDRIKRIFKDAVKDVLSKPELTKEIEEQGWDVVFGLQKEFLEPAKWNDNREEKNLILMKEICKNLRLKIVNKGKAVILEKVKLANEDNWSEFLPFYQKDLHNECRNYDDLLQKITTMLLGMKRLKRDIIFDIQTTRSILSSFRGEIWIRNLWKKCKLKQEIIEGQVMKSTIYVFTQYSSKKVYVGETVDLSKRFGKHMYEGRLQKTRKIYKIMRGIGLQRWFVIPVEGATMITKERQMLEKKWMHQCRQFLINEKWTWSNDKSKKGNQER